MVGWVDGVSARAVGLGGLRLDGMGVAMGDAEWRVRAGRVNDFL